MFKKYGALYIAKQVLKGMTFFGFGEICGFITGSICEEAGWGKVASSTATVAGWAVGGMVASKACEFIDETAVKIEKAIAQEAKTNV